MNRQSQWLFEAPAETIAERKWESPKLHLPVQKSPLRSQPAFRPNRPITIKSETLPPTSTRETVSRFPRYSNSITSLPPQEQQKIDQLARLIVRSYSSGQQPIRTIRLMGHADKDTPRRPEFERKISGDRALQVKNALIKQINQSRISSGIRWEVVGVGASQLVVQTPRTEAERSRNRRVDIHLITAPSPTPPVPPTPPVCNRISTSQCEQEFERCLKVSNNPLACLANRNTCYQRCSSPTPPTPPTPPLPTPPSTPTPPVPRTCCILAPTVSPLSSDSNLVDPLSLGTHRISEATGLIYTGKAGFFDLGHARDLCDLTKYVYDQIAAVRGVPVTVRTAHGTAVVHTAVPSSDWILVARSISYDDSFAYEIMTYDISGAGSHNSAFSPEDLCSNYLGTLLAEKAILAGGNFNAAVTTELATMIRLLDGQPKSETLRAINLINGCWINFTGVTDLFDNAYLKRRNFDRLPWYVGHSSDRPAPSWVTAGFGSVGRFYTYTHTARRTIPQADFAREVMRIRTDAASKYGPNFNNPRCP